MARKGVARKGLERRSHREQLWTALNRLALFFVCLLLSSLVPLLDMAVTLQFLTFCWLWQKLGKEIDAAAASIQTLKVTCTSICSCHVLTLTGIQDELKECKALAAKLSSYMGANIIMEEHNVINVIMLL